jgi:hypothetical protein
MVIVRVGYSWLTGWIQTSGPLKGAFAKDSLYTACYGFGFSVSVTITVPPSLTCTPRRAGW